MDIGGVAVARQLLEGQQNLVCFKCRRGVFTTKWWLTCWARLLLFSWRSPNGPVGNLLLNSCFMWGWLRISSGPPVTMWGSWSVPESIQRRDWQSEGPNSGWGSSWERCSFGSWFSKFVFRNVPGTVLECVRICGFNRNSVNLDRAHKMRDSVLLNSWDSFLVTLSSMSSETFVIYSSLILGKDVFRDWPLVGCSSCVSIVTVATFRLFLNVAIFWR